ncbi:hypothetical protein GHT09_005307 [Marmota monax]|uniref:Uncharacterized protein n=1 Tax=Marmota monax TaxID=9995 RepID=A0A834QSL5_MARMO|nr:hypothetical protein GHT09_005307 [Marmota monax]
MLQMSSPLLSAHLKLQPDYIFFLAQLTLLLLELKVTMLSHRLLLLHNFSDGQWHPTAKTELTRAGSTPSPYFCPFPLAGREAPGSLYESPAWGGGQEPEL